MAATDFFTFELLEPFEFERYQIMRELASFIRAFRFPWNWEAIQRYLVNLNFRAHRSRTSETLFSTTRPLFLWFGSISCNVIRC